MNNPYPSIFILGFALLWFMASCSNDEYFAMNPNGQPIQFTTNIGGVVKTSSRATNDTWAENDKVGISMTNKGYSAIVGHNSLHIADKAGTNVDLIPASGHELYYPLDGDARFIAYYPYNEDITYIDEDFYPIVLGNQNNTPAFDLLWYKDTEDTGLFGKDSDSPALAFSHQLSKIVVNLQFASGAEGVTINSAAIINTPTTASFDLLTGQISDRNKQADVNFVAATLSEEDTDAGIVQRFEAILIPHSGENKEESGGITFTNRRMTFYGSLRLENALIEGYINWDMPDEKVFDKGKRYIYNFIVHQQEINLLDTTIEEWNVETTDGTLNSTLTLSETEKIVIGEAATPAVSIKTNHPGAPQAVSSDESWLTVKSVAPSSKGRYDLVCECTENDGFKVRTATITVTAGGAQEIYTVEQYGYATIAEPANSVILTTGGPSVYIPVAFLNEVGSYPGISDGGQTYTNPFSDEANVQFEAKVLWIDSPNFADAALRTTTPTDIIAGVDVECSTLTESYLKVKPGTKPGNAVVCITKPGTNDIIWSWHIWVTTREDRALMWVKDSEENKIEKPAPTGNGYAFFPINLGAFQKEKGTGNSHPMYGMYYYWGRKDPLPFNVQPTMMGTSLSALPYVSNASALFYDYDKAVPDETLKGLGSIINPDKVSELWQGTIHLDGADNNSWGYCETYGYNSKSPFDPCPAGWRIPPGTSPGTVASSWPSSKQVDIDYDDFYTLSYGASGFFMSEYGGFYPEAGCKTTLVGNLWQGAYSTASALSGNRNQFMGDPEGYHNDCEENRWTALSVRCVTE